MADSYFVAPYPMAAATVIGHSTEASASFEAENVLRIQPTDRFRSTALNPAFVELDLGSAIAIDWAAILFANVDNNSATGRLRLATSQANLTASPGFDTTATTFWMNAQDYSTWRRVHTFFEFASQTFRYARFDVVDSANGDGYSEWGRIFLGVRSTTCHQYGSSYPAHVEPAERLESQGGTIHPVAHGSPDPRGRLHASIDLEFRTQAALHSLLWDLNRRIGTASEVVFVGWPDTNYEMHTLIYGLFRQAANVSIPKFSTWAVSVELEELV